MEKYYCDLCHLFSGSWQRYDKNNAEALLIARVMCGNMSSI